ncbi:MAG TPA: SurA N-terminal domain-containing protein [Stellaceae bacterium]|jgi:peptidyl-prolyl cis-trans isomerase D|nr:SurA N-terminal domain-containing protein [Stellaceae bacterium]
MLQAIRSKAGSVVVKGLFALLIMTFGIWGIGDIFRNRPTDTAVAAVGGQSIDANALQTALQPALERLSTQLGTQVDLRQAKQMGVVEQVLGQLVDDNLLDQEAQRMQLDVSDSVIRDSITQDPMFRRANGVFDRDAFNALLAANHMTEPEYVNSIRRDIPREDLLLAVTVGAAAPPAMVDRLYRYRDEKRVADIVTLPDNATADAGQPTDAELTKFYDAHQDTFRAPEYRNFTLASLTPSDLAPKIDIPEAKLKSAYDQRQDEFVLPERRDVQQILAPSEGQAKAAEAALAAGKDWTEVARTIAGQDPQTIDLGLMKREELPQNLADVAFGLELNKPSQPIKSALGWHILRVVRIVPPTTQSFDEAKAKLQADLAHNEAVDRLYTVANRVDDALAGGATLDEAAAKFGLKRSVVASVDEKGLGRDSQKVALPVSPTEVLKLAFTTEEGRTSRVTQASDGAIFVLHMDKIVPPTVRPLAEVKDKAVASWQIEKRKEIVAKQAEALAGEVTQGTQLAAVAAAKGLKAVNSPPFQRQSENATGVPPALVDKLFAAKPGGVVTLSDATGSYVAQLAKVEAPQAAATPELSREVTAGIQADLGEEYTRALRARFPVEIHRDTLDRLF